MFNILYIIIYVIIWRNYWNNERKLSLELVYGSWGLWGLLISSLLLVRLRLSNQCRSTKSNIAFSSVFHEHLKFTRAAGTKNFWYPLRFILSWKSEKLEIDMFESLNFGRSKLSWKFQLEMYQFLETPTKIFQLQWELSNFDHN